MHPKTDKSDHILCVRQPSTFNLWYLLSSLADVITPNDCSGLLPMKTRNHRDRLFLGSSAFGLVKFLDASLMAFSLYDRSFDLHSCMIQFNSVQKNIFKIDSSGRVLRKAFLEVSFSGLF